MASPFSKGNGITVAGPQKEDAIDLPLPPVTTDLDAKLHQGYDPDGVQRERGVLLGNIQLGRHGSDGGYTPAEIPRTSSESGLKPGLSVIPPSLPRQSIVAQADEHHAADIKSQWFPSGDTNSTLPNGHIASHVPSWARHAANVALQTLASATETITSNQKKRFSAIKGISVSTAIPAPQSPPHSVVPATLHADNQQGASSHTTDINPATLQPPVITLAPLSGLQGQPIQLFVALTADTGSGIQTWLTFSGVPSGATLSSGTDMGNGTWNVTPDELQNLWLTTPASWSGRVSLRLTAFSQRGGDIVSDSVTAPLTIGEIASPPALNIHSASGNEDTAIPITITTAPTDNDGSEAITVTIAGVPAGSVFNHGTDNGNGTWTFVPSDLTGLTLTPPQHWNGNLALSVTATASENGTTASTTSALAVAVAGVATAPSLSIHAASGMEDAPIALSISATPNDTDPSETLSVTITGVPAGALLNHGTDNGNGSWTLTTTQLSGLTLTPPASYNGSFNLSVTATASENGTTASTSGSIAISVTAVADAPSLSVQTASGNEDTAIPLSITSALTDNDPGESLSITIANVPAGSTFNHGANNGNGSWTFTPAQLSGLTFTPPANYNGSFNLSVTATAAENGTTASTNATLGVSVAGVADTPVLSVQAATGNEDTAIPLSITSSLSDTDSGETLSITVTGVAAGATLNHGTDNGGGSWTLTPAQLSGLTLTPPASYNGNFNLSITATSSENGTTASANATLGVTVVGAADAPSLSLQSASGNEDTAIPLSITSALTDNDPGETLSITIAGLPAGALLSAGTNNGNGSWTLSPAQLSGLTLTSPANYSGNFNLSVTATAAENGTTASTNTVLSVSVAGVADVPTLSVQNASGNEDNAIPLSITSALTDTDGSETLSLQITGVPAGAVLNHGTDNGGGNWTLTPAQLSGLTITPPANYNGNFNLSITATSSENGTTASTNATLGVTVAGVADPPTLSVQAASGNEDTAISLSISSALSDNDPGESLSITISGVPAGASLNQGVDNGGGSWTLTPAQLSGLTITPPANYNGSFNLSVTATAAENGTTASTATTLGVTVAGVADTPTLSVQPATGSEDTAIPLSISSGLSDNDPGETLSITIANVPAGSIFNHGTNNGNGSWTFASSDLSGLTLTPPANYNGALSLSVTAMASENGTTASANATLGVTVTGVADAPSLSVQNASGNEDTAIPLSITSALTDNDPGETLSITIGGVPAGATFNHGANNGNGTWTFAPSDLNGLTFTPSSNYNGTLNLSVTARAAENGTTATTTATLAVAVAGVADTPTLSVQAANGYEDSAIPIAITSALSDNDPGESLSVTITGIPTGATLNQGTDNGNGNWTLTLAQLSGLTLTPPANYSGSFNISVTATSSENGTQASTNTTLGVTVIAAADAPSLSVQPASGNEDTPIALSITSALTDNDPGETLSITIANVPAGASFNHGTDNGNGSWTLAPSDLTGLVFTPPLHGSGNLSLAVTATASENGTTASTSANLDIAVNGVVSPPSLTVQAASGNEDTTIPLSVSAAMVNADASESLSIVISNMPSGATLSAGTNNGDGSWTLTPAQLTNLTLTPPANWSGNVTIDVAAIATDGGHTASTNTGLSLAVAGVADPPTLSVQAASGNEDTAIPVTINAALTDTDGSETLSVTITGVPAGATFSAGTNNGNGSWTFTPSNLTNLTITPPSNYSGNFNLSVTATSSENGTTASANATLGVTVAGVADTPTLSVQNASGNEDTAIPLAITSALTDTDGSETLGITITGVPAGATLNHGTNNGGGSWTLTPAQLSGLTLTPPANYSGSFTLSVTATSSENSTTASANATLNVAVAGVADTPTLSVQSASGNEDTAISLNITSALTDTDGSETLSLTITGVPSGAVLNHGTNNGGGSWTLAPAQLSGLTITPAANYNGSFNLSVTATSSENNTTASANATLGVTVVGVADTPSLSVQNASGNEDTAIALSISSALTDNDSGETLSITITGVPTGATLNHGTNNGGGSWTLTPAQLSGLTITPASNYNGSFNLSVTSTASENGTTASANATIGVSVAGVADTPILSVQAASGNEDTAIPLTISSSLSDNDPGETLSITIANVPSGTIFNHGTNNGNGTWTFTPADLTGLTITPPANYNGALSLAVTATASENGTTASANATLALTVTGIADPPILSVQAANGNEDTAIPLSITSSLSDNDSGESLSITITGVPTGATLNHGTNNGGGSWTLTPAQLTGLTITPPSNYNGSFNLSVTATTSENGTTANTNATLGVAVAGVADTPTLSVQAASGNEDTAITLSITSALSDNDPGETLSLTITGVPTGAVLNHGINNGNGSWTLTPAQLSGLTITPASNYNGSFNLSVTSTASENGTTASASTTLGVTVVGVADTPTLSVQAASGNEDTPIALSITSALSDNDPGETLSITITGIPTGSILNHGTNNGNGSWTLTPAQLSGLTITPPANYNGSFNLSVTSTASENGTTASANATLGVTVIGVADTPTLSVQNASGNEDTAIPLSLTSALTDTDGSEVLSINITGVPTGATLSAGTYAGNGTWSLTPAQLSGLTITPPANYSGTMALTVKAISTEEGDGNSTSTGVALNVVVAPVADQPTLYVSTASGNENTTIPLSITSALTDTDGSETLSIKISGVPSGAVLNHGTNNGGGNWTLTPAQLSGLTITPPANSNANFTLTVTSTSTESAGGSASSVASIPVTVIGMPNTPTATASSVTGTGGTPIALTLGGSLINSDGSQTLTYLVQGVPAGFALNQGINNGDNTWTLTPAQLSGLTLISPLQFNGQVNLYVNAVAHESNGNVVMSAATPFNARIGAWSTGYLVDIGVNAHIGGIGVGVQVVAGTNIDLLPTSGGILGTNMFVKEDTPFLISDAPSLLGLPAISGILGLVASVQFTGVPAGATFSQGTNLGGGVWQFTQAQLTNLYMTPPANSDVDYTITAQAKLLSLATISLASAAVHVMGVADMPTLTASAGGPINEDSGSIPITITSALTDTDGSETLSFQISGMPAGFSLNHGINNGDGTWSLTSSDLTGLTMTPASNWSGSGSLTISAISTEREGDQAVKQTTASFSVTPVADAPLISNQPQSGTENTPLALNFGVALTDTDGSESISAVTVSGLPAGASLTNATNNGDGTWSVNVAQINNVKFVPATNWHGDVTLSLTAASKESANGVTASTNGTLAIHMAAVAATPTINAANISDQQNAPITLNISAGLTDSTEQLSVVVSGMPTGAILSAGVHNADNTWTLTPAQLSALSITPPTSFTGDMHLTATAYSFESSNGTSASAHQDFTVHVDYQHAFPS